MNHSERITALAEQYVGADKFGMISEIKVMFDEEINYEREIVVLRPIRRSQGERS